MSDRHVAFGNADLSNCDREEIHIPGSIQPHGALLVLEPVTLRVVQAGGDLERLLRATTSQLLGGTLTGRLSETELRKLAAAAKSHADLQRPRHLFALEFDDGNRRADALLHASSGFLILELEPQQESEPDDSLALVQSMMRRVQGTETISDAYEAIVDQVRASSGFDRVMLYRFLSDGSGSVEAEARGAGIEPYLGLRYPASDIPQQARALYLRNWTRLIGNAHYTPAPLTALAGHMTAGPIDLSQSALRSVSPIHLEYLANMGVVASMSLSLVIDGKLWGLIACHHHAPRFPPYRLRVAYELFAQMASFQLETKLEAADLGSRLQQKSISEDLINNLAGTPDLSDGLKRFRPNLLEYIPASGVALWLDGQFSSFGDTPNSNIVGQIVRWLNQSMTEGVFHTDKLSTHYPPAIRFAAKASGILALSVSRSPRDYVIWFRPEVQRTVTWAGNPNKQTAAGSDGARISPRKSFATWKQQVRLQSEPWTSLDVKTALSLRVSLLEVVLQHTDQLAREREQSRAQQQTLLAELDNRIAQWEIVAQELKRESDRRAILEAELSQVLRRTVLEQEAERQRIARELHDSLGQYLTVMRLDLDGIGREAEATESIRQRVEKLKSLTTDVGQEVNQLAWDIRPTALDDLGLQMAFEQFLEEWAERSTLKFDVHLALNDRLPPAIETTLYRVLQEAIRNVVKHADAKKVGVILEGARSEVRLIIEDDGKGFEWDTVNGTAAASDRLGLIGMRERLALVGGALEVETSPGSGTTLLIHVPL
jgi:light-regulated signal transduction histidine kinase (bacteriophytochrome)